jgi:galactokinase
VNLIGEHIDYNGGAVLPFAIPQRIAVAAALDDSGRVSVRSVPLDSSTQIPIDIAAPTAPHSWANYVEGMVCEARRLGAALPGAKLVIAGNLHPGCGLSSSAALCTAVGYALLTLADVPIDPRAIALAGQAAEHRFAGMPCGIMDQYVSCFGRADHALLVDCSKLTHEEIPFHATGVVVLAIHSGVKHALTDGAYERRVHACRRALAIFRANHPAMTSLHEVSVGLLEAHRDALDDESYRRARHVVSEVQRVHEAVAALRAADWPRLGALLWQTQDSLRDDYEVSCPEVNALIDVLRVRSDVYGARMIGGGFGGVVIALVPTDQIDAIEEHVRAKYCLRRNVSSEISRVRPSPGATAIRCA